MTMMTETGATKKNHLMMMKMMTVVATGDHHEEGGREIAEVGRRQVDQVDLVLLLRLGQEHVRDQVDRHLRDHHDLHYCRLNHM